jgi:SAM-dependent methyltransferase
MSITKAWDWCKNEDSQWLIPCIESAYLAENWLSKDFDKFLDLGCGLGRHAIYMAGKGFDVTAVDLSAYSVNYTKEWAIKEKLDIKTDICNMLQLPFEDDSFDCIMAYNVIYHTDTQGFKETLREIKRVLKPNGELFVTLLSKNTWSFQKAEQFQRIDDNTFFIAENVTEEGVPHFYVDIYDIKNIFNDWKFVQLPKEWCEYNIDKPEFYSKHWTVILQNIIAKQS